MKPWQRYVRATLNATQIALDALGRATRASYHYSKATVKWLYNHGKIAAKWVYRTAKWAYSRPAAWRARFQAMARARQQAKLRAELHGQTPNEAAIREMRLALKYLEDMDRIGEGMHKGGYTYDIKTMLSELSRASQAVTRARLFDPAAIYVEEHKDGAIRWTQDMLAAHILFQEAKGYETRAYNYPAPMYFDSVITNFFYQRRHKRERTQHEQENFKHALVAVERALEFWPDALTYLRFQAGMYAILGDKKKARQIIAKALSIAPDDLETHAAKDSIK